MESAQAFWALFDERVVFSMHGLVLDADDVYVGRDAAIEATRQYWGTFENYHLDVLEIIDAGASVVVVVHERVAGEAAALPSKGDGRGYGRSVVGGSFDGKSFGTKPKPSKPWG